MVVKVQQDEAGTLAWGRAEKTKKMATKRKASYLKPFIFFFKEKQKFGTHKSGRYVRSMDPRGDYYYRMIFNYY